MLSSFDGVREDEGLAAEILSYQVERYCTQQYKVERYSTQQYKVHFQLRVCLTIFKQHHGGAQGYTIRQFPKFSLEGSLVFLRDFFIAQDVGKKNSVCVCVRLPALL